VTRGRRRRGGSGRPGGRPARAEAQRLPEEPAAAPRRAPVPVSGDAGSHVETASRYGLVLAAVMAAVGLLLLFLAVAGRGWPYLLGAVDFLAVAAVLAWALRGKPGRPPA